MLSQRQDQRWKNSSALAYLSVICGEQQGGVIAGADGGGEEVLFVSEPHTGPLQHKSHKKHISIWTQRSLLWSHVFEPPQQELAATTSVSRGQMLDLKFRPIFAFKFAAILEQ